MYTYINTESVYLDAESATNNYFLTESTSTYPAIQKETEDGIYLGESAISKYSFNLLNI